MAGEVQDILVLRLGASVSAEIRNEFHAAVEEVCQALGIRHVIEDRRESEGWIRSFCILSPPGFCTGVEAVQWAREMACQIAERIHFQEALRSTKYCGVWIHLEEASASEEEEGHEESRKRGGDSEDGEEEGEDRL
jgi:hypothetical protein